MNIMWSRATDIQTYIHKEGNGKFSVMLPLDHIFLFCEHFNKLMYGAKHELLMSRTKDSDSMIRSSQKNAAGTADETKLGKDNLIK